MPNIKTFFVFGDLTIWLCLFILLPACNNIPRNNSHPEISNAAIKKGKALAAIYCQACHALPNPNLLDSKTWEKGVLPAMGPRLGIFSWNGTTYRANRYDMSLDKDFYPNQPLVKPQEWQNLIDYFVAASPDSILDKKPGQKPVKLELPLFSIKTPAAATTNPATVMVKTPENAAFDGIIVSDAIKQTLFHFDNSLKVMDSIKTRGPVVDVEIGGSNLLACNIGILNPNNGKYGYGSTLIFEANGHLKQDSSELFEGLQRPVQITSADLNKDGKPDYLVCEFGYLTGALSWMENKGNRKYERHVLRPLPGAIKAYVNDFNNDGLLDIWVLFAQGDEGIFLFTNKGNGRFDEKQVLRFPPVYGSSYFEFADFNKDGHPDIVYTCGDNADYSTILKPYHGVYIFINDGHNNFNQKYFFHINGCYKAIARDYDNDGDLDIATISFFADYKNHPEEGFVYLENKGNMSFSPYSSVETQIGRWLTMEAGDINKDGRIDLILGNFSVGPAMIKSAFDWKKGPPFIVLENTGKKHF